jgi:hypothetical protein
MASTSTTRTRHGHRIRYALASIAIAVATAAPAFAQSNNNACIVQQVGGNPPCTANDVRIGHMELVAGPSMCDPNDPTPFPVTIKATIESGPDRYDIGLWFNTKGNSAKDDPSGNNCYRDYLHPVDGLTTCQQQGGPYYNADGDNCGDVYAQNTNPCGNKVTGPCTSGMGGTCLFSTFTFTTMVTCTDSNADNVVDTGTCTSWDNMPDGFCTNELDTDPGTGSKCNCEMIDIVGLGVPPPTTTTNPTTTTTATTTTATTTTATTTTATTSTTPTTAPQETTITTTSSTTSTTETTTTSTTGTTTSSTTSTTETTTTSTATTTTETSTTATTSSTTATTATTTSSTTTTLCTPGPETNCDNMEDDDCDGKVDCMDPDCDGVPPCPVAGNDPTLIKFGRGGLDLLRGHASLAMTPVDVSASTVGVLLANPNGTIYRGSLDPGALVAGPSGMIFRYRNPDARLGGGLYSVKIKQRRDGSAYTFSFAAYADLSAATDPRMRLQLYIGESGDRPFITIDAPWTPTPSGWRAPKDH